MKRISRVISIIISLTFLSVAVHKLGFFRKDYIIQPPFTWIMATELTEKQGKAIEDSVSEMDEQGVDL